MVFVNLIKNMNKVNILKFSNGFLIYNQNKNMLLNYYWIPNQAYYSHWIFSNLLFGNLHGFQNWLIINGFGFRTSFQKQYLSKKLGFKIGFSHNFFYRLPAEVGLKRFNMLLRDLNKFKYGKIKSILFKTNNFLIFISILNTLKFLYQINAYKLKGVYFKNQEYLLKKIKKKTKTRV